MIKERDVTIDIAKGIGIILMVFGHSRCPEEFASFIRFFNMPLFFFISGYLFNENRGFREFFARKINGLWRPFVAFTLLLLLFHNLLYQCFFEHIYYTKERFLFKLLEIPFLFGWDSLNAGYWFIGALFYISVIYFLLFAAIQKIICNRIKISFILTALVFVLFLVSLIIQKIVSPESTDVVNCFWVEHSVTFLYGLTFYSFGKLFRVTKISMALSQWRVLLYVIILGIGAHLFPVRRPFSEISPIFSFYIVIMGMMGISVVVSFSAWLNNYKYLRMFLSYVGEHTLIILGLHLICFKIISVCYVFLHGFPAKMISQYPVIFDFAHRGGWIIYSFFGIVTPLLLAKVKSRIKSIHLNV